ncbi:hypothetical protein E2C01_061258 [Portunus trituberculatus]|uniref:Uncharacterized protein n=1 Tax=Portunus trituberculatus TaxID=210409 RepID=A0A5B7HA85_PORTR|nr:hypothetical protein [Portunus trituberculatus]
MYKEGANKPNDHHCTLTPIPSTTTPTATITTITTTTSTITTKATNNNNSNLLDHVLTQWPLHFLSFPTGHHFLDTLAPRMPFKKKKTFLVQNKS